MCSESILTFYHLNFRTMEHISFSEQLYFSRLKKKIREWFKSKILTSHFTFCGLSFIPKKLRLLTIRFLRHLRRVKISCETKLFFGFSLKFVVFLEICIKKKWRENEDEKKECVIKMCSLESTPESESRQHSSGPYFSRSGFRR